MRILVTLLALAASTAWGASTSVDGYYRKDGTYVAPHYRTTPDSNRGNNWSSQGNQNPYTGAPGTVNPYAPQSPTYPIYPTYPQQPRR